MKNVILIGANGSTSKEIIPRLLEEDDVKLTLFLRDASRMQNMQSDRVDVVEGDAARLADLTRAIHGQEIVISTMGGMDLDAKTANIARAMKEVGARHIVVISAGGIYDELPAAFNAWDKGMVGQYRPINLKAAEVAEQSGLAYTVLRPVWLTNKPTEAFRLTRKGETFKGTETSRASIGRFVADLVKEPQRYANQNLGISQPNTEGDRPAAYRRSSSANARRTDLPA
ncbi:SDR family oxidoreductase [Variovorax sp. LjRoot178]|uniref:SDR family oxidoreductase n=1 Tax=Variovorax sp. LjRoot178 TaxID=3342277 RepID=UPI003ED08C1A